MPWNKGFTKETHPSVLKISQTIRLKKIDNFASWRNNLKLSGKIPDCDSPFPESSELAEYIGVVLGDGNISNFPRTERILIVGDLNKMGFIKHYAKLTEAIFRKKPSVGFIKNTNAVRISLYQKNISQRLGIPTGNRSNLKFNVPNWITNNEVFIVKFIKGLFEAEGSLSIHKKTYTYNFQFSNKNNSLLKIVKDTLILLGYHPEVRYNSIRLRKKLEVERFKNLIEFRSFDNAG